MKEDKKKAFENGKSVVTFETHGQGNTYYMIGKPQEVVKTRCRQKTMDKRHGVQ